MARWSGQAQRGTAAASRVQRLGTLAVGSTGAAAELGDEAVAGAQLPLGERLLSARARSAGGDEAQAVSLAVFGDLDALPPRLVGIPEAAAAAAALARDHRALLPQDALRRAQCFLGERRASATAMATSSYSSTVRGGRSGRPLVELPGRPVSVGDHRGAQCFQRISRSGRPPVPPVPTSWQVTAASVAGRPRRSGHPPGVRPSARSRAAHRVPRLRAGPGWELPMSPRPTTMAPIGLTTRANR